MNSYDLRLREAERDIGHSIDVPPPSLRGPFPPCAREPGRNVDYWGPHKRQEPSRQRKTLTKRNRVSKEGSGSCCQVESFHPSVHDLDKLVVVLLDVIPIARPQCQ